MNSLQHNLKPTPNDYYVPCGVIWNLLLRLHMFQVTLSRKKCARLLHSRRHSLNAYAQGFIYFKWCTLKLASKTSYTPSGVVWVMVYHGKNKGFFCFGVLEPWFFVLSILCALALFWSLISLLNTCY